jgi:hypothetical protein
VIGAVAKIFSDDRTKRVAIEEDDPTTLGAQAAR